MNIRPEQFEALSEDHDRRLLQVSIQRLRRRFPATTGAADDPRLNEYAQKEKNLAEMLGFQQHSEVERFIILRWFADFEAKSKLANKVIARVLHDVDTSANERLGFLERYVLAFQKNAQTLAGVLPTDAESARSAPHKSRVGPGALTIRKEQMQVLSAYVRLQFEDRIINYLRPKYPEKIGGRSELDLRGLVSTALTQAASYGIIFGEDVRRYLDFMVQYGVDFDTNPKTAWAGRTLRDTNLTGTEKMNRLDEYETFVLR